MGALFNKKKNKDGYSLKISELNFDAPKIVKIKKSRKPWIALTALAILGSIIIPSISYAETTPPTANRKVSDSSCWLNQENSWAKKLGGVSTAQYSASRSNVGARVSDYSNEPTIRDRFGEDITFTTWIPTVRYKDDTDKSVKIMSSVPNNLTWANIGDDSWGGMKDGNLDMPIASDTSKFRQTEYIHDNGALFSDKFCEVAMMGPTLNDAGPNMVFNLAKGINNISSFLYVQASAGSNITDVFKLNTDSVATSTDQLFVTSNNQSWTKSFGDTVNKILVGDGSKKGLYDSLYLDFLLPVILIGALVVLINAIRSKAIKALTGIFWMIGAIVGGMLFLQNPMFVPQLIDGIVGTITGSVTKAIIGDTSVTGCDIPNDSKVWGDEKLREAKETECYIWYNTIYIPWAEGTYGVKYDTAFNNRTSTGADASPFFVDPQGVLAKTVIDMGGGEATNIPLNPTNSKSMGWPLYQLEYQNQPAATNIAIAENTLGSNAKWFQGGDKWGAAGLTLAVSLASGIFIGINSTLIISYQLVMLLLLLVAPLFLLIAIVPSRMGKGIGLRWAEMIVGIAIKRSVIAVMLAVFLKMFIIVTSIQGIGVGMQAILFGVLAVIGITQRSKIMEMFTGSVNFGGDKSINIGGGIETAGAKVGALAGGAVLAGGAIAASRVKGGAKMAMVDRRANKNQKVVDAASTNEEKLAIIRQQEEKAERKAIKQSLRSGNATVSGATRAQLNRAKSNVHFDAREENQQEINQKLGNVIAINEEGLSTPPENAEPKGRNSRQQTAETLNTETPQPKADNMRERSESSNSRQGRTTREAVNSPATTNEPPSAPPVPPKAAPVKPQTPPKEGNSGFKLPKAPIRPPKK